jgi:16S rRNA (guanine527-N7)-methyltransferase
MSETGIDRLRAVLAADGIVMTDFQAALIERYVELLLAHNTIVNLVSRKDTGGVWTNHLLHSLAVLAIAPPPPSGSYLDIGTGGGLPGIPLAIMLPEARFTLVDSIGKKIRAVVDMIESLGLPNAFALNGRVDELARARKLPDDINVITARAVAPLDDLVTWARPVLRGGRACTLIAWKGGDLAAEYAAARRRAWVGEIEEYPIRLSAESVFEHEQKKLVRVALLEGAS